MVTFYKTFISKRNSITVICLLLLLSVSKSWGQAILTFDFAGALGDEASYASSTNNANINSSTITRTGLTASANGDRFGSTNFSTSAAIDLTKYIEFTITPLAGYQMTITSVVFLYQRSGSGPLTFALRSSLDAYASNLGGALAGSDVTGTQTFNFSFSALTPSCSSPITFRLYAYAAELTTGTGGPEDGGNTTNKDIVVNGSVALCGSATPHTVTFNANGGSGTMSAQTETTTANLTSNTYTNSNSNGACTFTGWNTAANGSGTAYANNASYNFAADMTLYAQWNCPIGSGTVCIANGAIGSGYTYGCGDSDGPCDLATTYAAYGTFCNGSATVACGAGCTTQNISTTYNLESTCSATITAQYMARGIGCKNSAMDGGDKISITSSGGTVTAQSSTMAVTLSTCAAYPSLGTHTTSVASLTTGCGNSDGTVQMIITGGAVTIGGTVNRGDEIITYSISTSGTCTMCTVALPVELVDYYALENGKENDVLWKVFMEENIDKYIIERSSDGVNFSFMEMIKAKNINDRGVKVYSATDYIPNESITYYRLSAIENTGAFKVYSPIYIDRLRGEKWNYSYHQTEGNIVVLFKNIVPKNSTISLYDLSGQLLDEAVISNSQTVIPTTHLSSGIYFVKISSPYKTENFKVIISK